MSRLSIKRRAATAGRWPVGVCVSSWNYLWRTTPMSRSEVAGRHATDRSPGLPDDFELDGVQTDRDGAGPLFHRTYRVWIAEAELSPAELIDAMREDPDIFAPTHLASFQKVVESGLCRPGDEYVVRMPGPWDGPVRVVEVTESKIRLATLQGHLEAGQIEFRATAEEEELCFTIESWARSATTVSDLLYDRLKLSKEIQLHMWLSFLERVVKRSGGRRSGCIEIHTRRVDEPPDG